MAGPARLRPFLNEAGEKKIAGSFKRFADIHLSRVAAELRSAVQHLAVEDAADQLPKLSRDIDSVQLLAGAYGDAVSTRREEKKIAGSFKRFAVYSPLAGGGRAAQRRAASGGRRCR